MWSGYIKVKDKLSIYSTLISFKSRKSCMDYHYLLAKTWISSF